MTPEQIQLIQQLLNGLSFTATTLFQSAVRYTIAYNILNILISVFFMVLIVRGWKWAGGLLAEDMEWEDQEASAVFIFLITRFCCVLSFAILIMFSGENVAKLIAPEWAAVERVLDLLTSAAK